MIADHLPVFCIIYDPDENPFPDIIELRNFKHFQSSNFRSELKQVNWTSVFNCANANEGLSRFSHFFNRISNKHAPLKIFHIKSSTTKPWITTGLLKSIKNRDKLYKKWLQTRNPCILNKS